jgi:hypothetical protein
MVLNFPEGLDSNHTVIVEPDVARTMVRNNLYPGVGIVSVSQKLETMLVWRKT